MDRRVAEIEALLATAHFRSALAVTQATRQEIETLAPHPELGSLRARLEVMSATAEVALGRRDQARQSLIRALEADPSLALDERTASPKLLDLLREARRHTGIAEPPQ